MFQQSTDGQQKVASPNSKPQFFYEGKRSARVGTNLDQKSGKNAEKLPVLVKKKKSGDLNVELETKEDISPGKDPKPLPAANIRGPNKTYSVDPGGKVPPKGAT